jgi:hypothetical protein
VLFDEQLNGLGLELLVHRIVNIGFWWWFLFVLCYVSRLLLCPLSVSYVLRMLGVDLALYFNVRSIFAKVGLASSKL